MVLDVGRIKHRADLMHRSVGSNGVATPSNWVLSADGLTNVIWTPRDSAGGGSVSYGSNANDVSSSSAPGASSLVSRADHVHRGMRSLSHSSNTFFGNVILVPGQNMAVTSPTPGTFTLSAAGSTSGGGGGGSGPTDYVSGAAGTGHLTIPGIGIADQVPGSPHANDHEFDAALSGWTTRGTLDTSDANSTYRSHLYLSRVVNETGINGIDRSFSSSRPLTITTKFAAVSGGANYHHIMLYLTDGSKYMSWGPINQVADSLLERTFWSNRTTRSGQSDYTGAQIPMYSGPFYLRLTLTSDTNISIGFSYNGLLFMTYATGLDPSMTCSNFGVGLNDFAGNKTVEVLVDWIRFT